MCLHLQLNNLLTVLKIDDFEDKFRTVGINEQEVLVGVTWQGGHRGGRHPVQPLGQFSRLILGEFWLWLCLGFLFTFIEKNKNKYRMGERVSGSNKQLISTRRSWNVLAKIAN